MPFHTWLGIHRAPSVETLFPPILKHYMMNSTEMALKQRYMYIQYTSGEIKII